MSFIISFWSSCSLLCCSFSELSYFLYWRPSLHSGRKRNLLDNYLKEKLAMTISCWPIIFLMDFFFYVTCLWLPSAYNVEKSALIGPRQPALQHIVHSKICSKTFWDLISTSKLLVCFEGDAKPLKNSHFLTCDVLSNVPNLFGLFYVYVTYGTMANQKGNTAKL